MGIVDYKKHLVECPNCKKEILDHMTECPFCKEKVKRYAPMEEKKLNRIRLIVNIASIVIAAAVLIYFFMMNSRG